MCAAETRPANHWFHFSLQAIGIFFCVYFYLHLPKSGKALLVLCGIVAVMMLMDMRPVHKGIYVLIVLGLVLTENRALDKERKDTADEQSKRASEENTRFEAILRNNQEQFDATMGRINTTLRTSERTLKNTQPYASLEFEKIAAVLTSREIAVDRQIEFNVDFTNAGNDMATSSRFDAKAYVRKLDRKVEEEIANDFNKWWQNSEHPGEPIPIAPRAPSATFRFKTSPFIQDEVNGISDHTQTVYVLIRFTWSDQTGHWINDDCFWFADVTKNYDGRPCDVFKHYRYRSMLPN